MCQRGKVYWKGERAEEEGEEERERMQATELNPQGPGSAAQLRQGRRGPEGLGGSALSAALLATPPVAATAGELPKFKQQPRAQKAVSQLGA